MITLKIALFSLLVGLSLNSFAGTNNAPWSNDQIQADRVLVNESENSRDVSVKDLLQRMTMAAHQQVMLNSVHNERLNRHHRKHTNK